MITPEVISNNSGFSYILSNYFLSAARMRNTKRLAMLAEKHLLTGDENEELKRRGLTVLDALEGKFDVDYDYSTVNQLLDTWNARLGAEIFIIK